MFEMNSTRCLAGCEFKGARKRIFLKKLNSGLKIFRERGFREFTRELSKKIYFKYQANWYVCDLTSLPGNLFSSTEDFTVVNNLFDETISWMIDLGISGITNPHEIENMRNEGHMIYTLVSKDLISGYIKIGKGRVYIPDFDQDIYFPQNTAFVMDTYIHEDYRGKKLFHLLISAVKSDLITKGNKKLYCHIRIDNLTSISAFEKNGFKKTGMVCFKRTLWKRTLDLPPNFLT